MSEEDEVGPVITESGLPRSTSQESNDSGNESTSSETLIGNMRLPSITAW